MRNLFDLGRRRSTSGSGWPRRSPRRFKAVIRPAVVTVAGLVLLAVPSVRTLGLAIFLGGLAAVVLTAFLAGVGD